MRKLYISSNVKKIFFIGITLIFACYLCWILKLTVFRKSFSLERLFQNGELNLIPIRNFFMMYKMNGTEYFYYQFFGNILCFIPFGFFLPCLSDLSVKKMSFWKTALYTFLFSLLIETAQFIFGVGYTETDDLILNTFGGAVGAGIYYCFAYILRKFLKSLENFKSLR
jgi:glycopeptide antibiotics resistance protein